MSQSRTAALAGLEDLICAAITGANAEFVRDPEYDPVATASGLVIMRDGDPGDPDVYLSPVQFCWEHKVAFEILVQGPDRAATTEALIALIDPACAQDRTLGGLVDDARVIDAPDGEDNDPVEGVPPTRDTQLYVTLSYVTVSGAG